MRDHRRVHPHLRLNLHHGVAGDDNGICRNWCRQAVLIIVTVHIDLLFIIDSADLFDIITAVIIVDLNHFDDFDVMLFIGFNNTFKLALAAEYTETRCAAIPVCALTHDDTQNDH